MVTAIPDGSPALKKVDLPLELTRENQLLLLCSRQRLRQSDAASIRSLLEDGRLDWETVVHDARWHKLSGFLYQHLHVEPFAGFVPEGALAVLKGDFARNTARYLYYRNELTRIVRRLDEAAIPVIALKGSALVGSVYASPGVRPMADIDVLVPEDQVRDAHNVVKAMGFQAGEDDSENPQHWALHQHLPILVGVDRAVAVEVHRHVVRKDSALAFDISEFWARAVWAEIDGVPVKVFCPEDLLIHLSINFFRDRRFYSLAALSQLTDIAEVCRSRDEGNGIDWQALVTRARAGGIEGPVACGLTLASRLVDAPIPEDVLRSLWTRPLPAEDLAAFAAERVLTCSQWSATELVPAGKTYGFRSVVAAAWHRLFPNRSTMVHQYGGAGVGAYAQHIRHRLPLLARLMLRPWSIGGELTVDRWMHSLYRKPPTAADMTDD